MSNAEETEQMRRLNQQWRRAANAYMKATVRYHENPHDRAAHAAYIQRRDELATLIHLTRENAE